MFLQVSRSGYDQYGEQRTSGLFLMLVMPDDQHGACTADNVRAIVRHTTLKQFGPWMMGSVRIAGHRLTVSGSYGADGLIMNVSPDVYAMAVPLPKELYEAWSTGGGHNAAGSESSAMRQWARKNIARLYNVKRASNLIRHPY